MAHSEALLRRFHRPQYVHSDETLHRGSAGSRLAGAQIELHLGVREAVWQARFRAYGCPATVASADWLAQALDGQPLDAPLPDRHAIIRALQLPPARQHCAALAVEAMQAALAALRADTL